MMHPECRMDVARVVVMVMALATVEEAQVRGSVRRQQTTGSVPVLALVLVPVLVLVLALVRVQMLVQIPVQKLLERMSVGWMARGHRLAPRHHLHDLGLRPPTAARSASAPEKERDVTTATSVYRCHATMTVAVTAPAQVQVKVEVVVVVVVVVVVSALPHCNSSPHAAASTKPLHLLSLPQSSAA